MADPVIVECPKDVWTLVAENQTTGIIHILKVDSSAYLQTYRDTGGGAPATPADDGEAVPFRNFLQISSAAAIDVYIKCLGKDGRVRVDL